MISSFSSALGPEDGASKPIHDAETMDADHLFKIRQVQKQCLYGLGGGEHSNLQLLAIG